MQCLHAGLPDRGMGAPAAGTIRLPAGTVHVETASMSLSWRVRREALAGFWETIKMGCAAECGGLGSAVRLQTQACPGSSEGDLLGK